MIEVHFLPCRIRARPAPFGTHLGSLAFAGGITLVLLGACFDVAETTRATAAPAEAGPLGSFSDESRLQARSEPLFVTFADSSNSSLVLAQAGARANAELPGANDADGEKPCLDSSMGDAPWKDEVIAKCMTREHNRARSQLAVSPALLPLTWSRELATSAREWAAHLAGRCQGLEHPKRARYGQNLAARASIGEGSRFAPPEVVNGWMAEGQCWTPGKVGVTDRCDAACVAGLNSTGCGHYTQLIWRATRTVGCAYTTCRREGFLDEYWICNYAPAGNVRGRTPY